jgi:ABC-type multidrug transport system fused ATPase/permease subunit
VFTIHQKTVNKSPNGVIDLQQLDLQQVPGHANGATGRGQILEDEINLELIEVTFGFSEAKKPVLDAVSCCIPQGTLVGVVGPLSSGKATLLHILGQVLVPHIGTVLIPPHLRVLHIEQTPAFLNRAIADNLFFGVLLTQTSHLPQKELDRGWRICERLGFPHRPTIIASPFLLRWPFADFPNRV